VDDISDAMSFPDCARDRPACVLEAPLRLAQGRSDLAAFRRRRPITSARVIWPLPDPGRRARWSSARRWGSTATTLVGLGRLRRPPAATRCRPSVHRRHR